MKALKKFLAATVLGCVAVISIFAQESSKNLSDKVLDRVCQWEKSGKLLPTDGYGRETDDGKAIYIGDEHIVYLVEADFDVPYFYTRVWDGSKGIILIAYGVGEEARFYIDSSENALKDLYNPEFTKGDIDIDEIKSIVGSYGELHEIQLDGKPYSVVFENIDEEVVEEMENNFQDDRASQYTDDQTYDEELYETEQSVRPSYGELEELYKYILDFETSKKYVDSSLKGIEKDGRAYISDGKNLFLIDDQYHIPFEYNRAVSNVEGIPNIIFVTYGHDDSWDRYYFSKNKEGLASYEGSAEFFDIDMEQVYNEINGYTISYRSKIILDGVEYEVLFSDINDDQSELEEPMDGIVEYEEDVYEENDEIVPALNKSTLDSLLNDLVKDMNGKKYPSLYKTDKPYAIEKDAGRYILKTGGYTTHVDVTGDYFVTVQLYTSDFENGLMVLGFTRGSQLSLYRLVAFGESQVDEEAVEEAHRKGEFYVSEQDMEEFLAYVEEEGYVYDKSVVVDGVNYHAYCIPFDESDWEE